MKSTYTPAVRKWLLDFDLPVWVRGVFVVLLAIIPVLYVAGSNDPKTGLTTLIFFGQQFGPDEMPALRALHPAALSPSGYDGQFYAQLALDPSLRDPHLKTALDSPGYRSGRILIPFLSFFAGLGRPPWIITAYALMSLIFWGGLIAALIWFIRPRTPRQYLCIAAIMVSTGTLICIQRALVDLPGATIAFCSVMLEGSVGALWMAAAVLAKPTQLALLLRYFTIIPQGGTEWKKRGGLIFLALIFPVFWQLYVHDRFGYRPEVSNNFGLPLKAFADCLASRWLVLTNLPFDFQLYGPTKWERAFFEFMAPVSLGIQAFFILRRPEWKDALWCMGGAFAILFIFLGSKVLAEQIAISRVLLPLTIAFNVRLMRQTGPSFALYFVFGNIGLLGALHDMFVFCHDKF